MCFIQRLYLSVQEMLRHVFVHREGCVSRSMDSQSALHHMSVPDQSAMYHVIIFTQPPFQALKFSCLILIRGEIWCKTWKLG